MLHDVLAFLRMLCGRDASAADDDAACCFRERCQLALSARLLDAFRSGIVLRFFEAVLCCETDLADFLQLAGLLPFYVGLGESLGAFRKGEAKAGLLLCLVDLVTRAVRCLEGNAAAKARSEDGDPLAAALRLSTALLSLFNFGVHLRLREAAQRLLAAMAALHGRRLQEEVEQQLAAVHEDFHQRRRGEEPRGES